MRYLAVLGRQAEISLAELEALFSDVRRIPGELATFECAERPNIDRLGGCLKIGIELGVTPLEFLRRLPEGKITLGISDYSRRASRKTAKLEALKLKKILVRHGRSVRVVENKEAVLSTATSLHNGLSGKNPKKVELIRVNEKWYSVIGVQNVEAYARRDQARPARDAKVGMLPPKLAQILINLCGELPTGARILDPFCGTGVVLQEALLMGDDAYGTDISERMVELARRNLEWLDEGAVRRGRSVDFGVEREEFSRDWGRTGKFELEVGNATTFAWRSPIDAVVCEGYLGQPMSLPPAEIKLKGEKQECERIILGFLKNLVGQIAAETPVVVAAPAWLRENGEYSRLEMLDSIEKLGYNVNNKSREGLLYHREGQVVARDIIILRKK